MPPTAEHVETVFRTAPVAYRLPLLWLDWSGARVASIDTLRSATTTSRAVASACAPQQRRRAALWVELPTCSPMHSSDAARRAKIATPTRACSPVSSADALRTAIARACKAAGVPAFSRTTFATAGSAFCTGRGAHGRRSRASSASASSVTADTYTHVLVDEREVDYAELLAGRKTAVVSVRALAVLSPVLSSAQETAD